jgi:L-asparaginase II
MNNSWRLSPLWTKRWLPFRPVTTHWLEASDGALVAELVRDGQVESLHHGVLSVVDQDGATLLQRGNPEAIVYPRSTLKPLQALAVLETGIQLTPLQLTLTTASHCGSSAHREAVNNFLLATGLDESALQCPEDWPLGHSERADFVAEGHPPSRLAMNCSGKHAGFLAACAHAGFSTHDYLGVEHPLQQGIVDTITRYTGEVPAFTSRDGCGAPLHALSVHGLARGIAKIAAGNTAHEQELLSAVHDHAWAIDGEGRDNTVTIETLGGIAKIGAEGLVVVGAPSGVAVAVKILDGSMRATSLVALAALATVGAISPENATLLSQRMAHPVMGGDAIIGALKVRL